VPAKGLFRILFATSFHFYFTCEVHLSVVPTFVPVLCAARVRLSMLIGWHSNRVIWWLPFFSRVALWASRAEVWVLFAYDASRDCRKSDWPTNSSVCRTKHLINRLTLACEILAELLRCVARMNCLWLFTSIANFVCWSGWTVFPSRQDQWDS